MSDTHEPTSRRPWYTLAAVLAGAVAVLFATVGDGVDKPQAQGFGRILVEYGHTVTWILLAAAFAVAAMRGSWGALSQACAVAAGACYVLFLATVLLG